MFAGNPTFINHIRRVHELDTPLESTNQITTLEDNTKEYLEKKHLKSVTSVVLVNFVLMKEFEAVEPKDSINFRT